MKVYTKIVYDKDDNIIEEHSYNYKGPVSRARTSYEKVNYESIYNKTVEKVKKAKVDRFGSGQWGPKPTIKKNTKWISNISDANQLNKFASYNALFTLSALSEQDLLDPKDLKIHDIIAKSGGIGPVSNQTQNPISKENKKILEKNERMQGAANKSREMLSLNRDLYFKNVTMDSVPGLNSKRRTTSVTNITIELEEPYGITLLEKIRGAALNNNYLDHLDAPYMLTIEFAGFNELGKPIPQEVGDTTKRVIPIKLIDMAMEVNAGGTSYTLTAIPWGEFAYVNTFNFPQTTGTLYPKGNSIREVINSLETILNKQKKDDKEGSAEVELPDVYEISIHKDLNPDAMIQMDNLDLVGMNSQSHEGPASQHKIQFMKFNGNKGIIKILEEIMKGHPNYADSKLEDFHAKASTTLAKAQALGGELEVIKQANEFFFKYFRIRSNVIPLASKGFDIHRGGHPKKIIFVIEPYNIHAYSMTIPGVSTGNNFKDFVMKTYDYIFTGDNTNVLSLDIHYRVAYFQGRLKDIKKENPIFLNSNHLKPIETGAADSNDYFTDGNLHLKSEVITVKSEGTDRLGKGTPQLDAFLDSLTNPLADMVNVRLEILGDPAWIGQSSFIPTSPLYEKVGVHTDPYSEFWRHGANLIWNQKLHCYNTDLAEPIVMLRFRMPTDVNDKTGVYELQSDQSAEFSGLYRVYKVEHNFTEGKYTNVLQLTRFNNQGAEISNPLSIKVLQQDGKFVAKVNSKENKDFWEDLKTKNLYDFVSKTGRTAKDLLKHFLNS